MSFLHLKNACLFKVFLNQFPSDQTPYEPTDHGKKYNENYPSRRRVIPYISVNIAIFNADVNLEIVISFPEKPKR